MVKWTNSQHKAIYESGKNILVSAGAGSGKTAVLSTRTIEIIKKGININQLLILTFTRASAFEMKERIRKKLKEENLTKQLDLIDTSYITTFDSFSLSIVKRYHYLLNISQNIKISPDSYIKILNLKIIDEVFDEFYDLKDIDFLLLISDFCMKDDKDIRQVISRFYDELDKRIDVLGELNTINHKLNDETYYNDLKIQYLDVLKIKIADLRNLFVDLLNNSGSKVYQVIDNYYKELDDFDYHRIKEILKNIELPRKTNDCTENYSDIKKIISENISSILEFMHYDDLNGLVNEHHLTHKYIKPITKILQKVILRIDEEKKKQSLYTFNDIARLAIKLVSNNEIVRNELQNEFYEIMIDEYQDTSDIQEEFIKKISNNNVYSVGDIKQSIYRFRNANPNIFKEKYDSFGLEIGGIKIDLLDNFRSRKEVLSSINTIFNRIMTDKLGGANYQASHQMIYGNKNYDQNFDEKIDYNIEVLDISKRSDEFKRNEIEIFTIANDIKKKIDDKVKVFDGKLREAKLSDFAILIDKSSDFDLYKMIFEYVGIPLQVFKDESITASFDFKVLLNLFKFIYKISINEYDNTINYLYASIARSFLFKINDNEIFLNITNKSIYNTNIFIKCKEIARSLHNYSIYEFVNIVIDNFNYYDLIIKIGGIEGAIKRVEYLLNLAYELGSIGLTIGEYIDHLDKTFELGLDIPYKVSIGSDDAVKLMTIHASKGLEFSFCYFSGLNHKFNKSDIKQRFIYDPKLSIITPYYDNGIKEIFVKELYKFNFDFDEISEKIRLFYVALTRAKEKIILVDEVDLDDIKDISLLKINSFHDILKNFYDKFKVTKIDTSSLYKLSNSYQIKHIKNYKNSIPEGDKFTVQSNNYTYELVSELSKYSKNISKVITKDEFEKMELGTKLHNILELLDFKNNDINQYINNLDLEEKYKNVIIKFFTSKLLERRMEAIIYKEYEFYTNDSHGIIDLMMEYYDYIDIIDYKLKNIDDENYFNQLRGYRDYIVSVTKKKVNIYLYSLFDGIYQKID